MLETLLLEEDSGSLTSAAAPLAFDAAALLVGFDWQRKPAASSG